MLSVRLWGAILVAVSAAALASAWSAEYVLGLPPCEMCLLERIPWRIVFFLGVVGFLFGERGGAFANIIAVPVLFAGVLLSFVHIGVEFKWWESPFPACHAPTFRPGNFSQHMKALPLRPLKPCDAPTYLFDLPISMAFVGGLLSLVVFCYALFWSTMYFITPRKRFKRSVAFR